MDAPLRSELSHGTVEVRDLDATRRFYEEFLGLTVIRPLPMAIYASAGGMWQLVCVRSGMKLKPHGAENRFCLHVADEAAVRAAHAAARAERDTYGINAVGDLAADDGALGFMLQDLDLVWWEICARAKLPLGKPAEAVAA